MTLKWKCWKLHSAGHFKLGFTTLKNLCGQILILSTSCIGLPCTNLLLTSLVPCTKQLFTSRKIGGSVELDKNLAYNEWFEWMNLELARKYKHMPHLLGTFMLQENSGSTQILYKKPEIFSRKLFQSQLKSSPCTFVTFKEQGKNIIFNYFLLQCKKLKNLFW